MAHLRTLARAPGRSLPRTLLVTLVAGLLLMMQAMVLVHQLDLEHHAGGEPCELCLHLSSVDHGLTASQPALQPSQPDLPAIIWTLPQTHFPLHHAYHSRAPPRLS